MMGRPHDARRHGSSLKGIFVRRFQRRLPADKFDNDRIEGALKQDPKKWEPVFPRDKRESVCAEIMLKQRDEIMMGFNLIAS
jgi:hypothetical protein